jgi:hypothetical protein
VLVRELLAELVDRLEPLVGRRLGFADGLFLAGQRGLHGLLGGFERGVQGLGLGGVPLIEHGPQVRKPDVSGSRVLGEHRLEVLAQGVYSPAAHALLGLAAHGLSLPGETMRG